MSQHNISEFYTVGRGQFCPKCRRPINLDHLCGTEVGGVVDCECGKGIFLNPKIVRVERLEDALLDNITYQECSTCSKLFFADSPTKFSIMYKSDEEITAGHNYYRVTRWYGNNWRVEWYGKPEPIRGVPASVHGVEKPIYSENGCYDYEFFCNTCTPSYKDSKSDYKENLRNLHKEWVANGACEECGAKLGFFERLFGNTKCSKHR